MLCSNKLSRIPSKYWTRSLGQAQIKAMGEGLQHQTDDLIVAKINELKGAGKGGAGVGSTSYVLNNALTPGERKELAASKRPQSQVHAVAARNSPVKIFFGFVSSKLVLVVRNLFQLLSCADCQASAGAGARSPRRAAAAAGSTPNMSKLDQFEPSFGSGPGGPGGAGSSPPNTEGMLSAYDRQLLAAGPGGGDASNSGDGGGAGGRRQRRDGGAEGARARRVRVDVFELRADLVVDEIKAKNGIAVANYGTYKFIY